MADVKSINETNKGLYATRDYKEGDVILLEESPLIRLAPASTEDEASYLAELKLDDKPQKATKAKAKTAKPKNDAPSLYTSIPIPQSVAPRLHGKFRSMVQAAVSYACQAPDASLQERLLNLYYPSLSAPCEEEKEVVETAQLALQFTRERAQGDKIKALLEDDDETALKVMLLWTCNSFEGGRIYDTTSRINHSCNPNAVVKVDAGNENAQSIVAATTIQAGDEICISYLGTMLYADRPTRSEILKQEKHFHCQCTRCVDGNDLAARIPCVYCHPRQVGQPQLDEDVQYDDEHTVKYMSPTASDGVLTCERCQSTIGGSDARSAKFLRTTRSIVDKVSAFVRDSVTDQNSAGDDKDDDDDHDLVQQSLREQHLELASSFLGTSHWTTNLLLLLELTQLLEQHHASLLDTSGEMDAEADMETVAQGIDMLERLIRFVDGLELKLHRGHLLSDMIIGIARALVSLGDVKSQKYAVDWLDRLDDYVEKYDSEGMQKVVHTLRVAWTRESDQGQDEPDSNKKLKIC